MANVKSLGVGITILVVAAGYVLLPDPTEHSKLVDYQIRCTQAQAFHDSYLPVAAKKAGLGSMYTTDGEAWRPDVTAKYYAAVGKGIKNSLHTNRLARDKNLYINGVYQTTTPSHAFSGLLWETIAPAFGVIGVWGGRFRDGNHYSCEWEGRQ